MVGGGGGGGAWWWEAPGLFYAACRTARHGRGVQSYLGLSLTRRVSVAGSAIYRWCCSSKLSFSSYVLTFMYILVCSMLFLLSSIFVNSYISQGEGPANM